MADTLLKYTLYVWTEEQFRNFRSRSDDWDIPGPSKVCEPCSYEMYDISEEALKEQLADNFGCTADEVFPSQGCQSLGSETAFGLTFWDVAYPEGIGSYLIAVNTLDD